MNLWNNGIYTHLIRRNRLADCPSGVLKEMYETPGLVGVVVNTLLCMFIFGSCIL